MNSNHFAFFRQLACVIFVGLIAFSVAGCGDSENTVIEAASEEELLKSEAELSGVTEEEYEKGMNEM